MQADDHDAEARARNRVLTELHGRPPSYALWSGEDLRGETLACRKRWWTSLSHQTATTELVERMRTEWVTELNEGGWRV